MSRRELLSLLKTARENPDDVAPRLVVADWLEEHGDEADRARAEYVRLTSLPNQSRTEQVRERLSHLYSTYRDAWLGPLEELSEEVVFGPLVALGLTGQGLLGKKMAQALETEAGAWVGALYVSVEESQAAAVAASELLGYAGYLRLNGKLPALRVAFHSPHLARVRHLNLLNLRLTDEGVVALAASPHLGNVEVLELNQNRFGDPGLTALARAASLGRLRRLDLSEVSHGHDRIGPAGVAALAASRAFPSLTELNLDDSGTGDDGAAALAAGPVGAKLEVLRLSRSRIGPDGAKALAYGRFPRLRSLVLFDNPLGEVGVAALAATRLVGVNPALCLDYCRMGDGGAHRLAASRHAERLTELYLRGNKIGEAGARAIADGRWAGLRHLGLSWNLIGDAGARAIAASPALAQLRTLELTSCEIGREGALALARSPFLAHLEQLTLSIEPEGARQAVAALKERFGKRVEVGVSSR